MEYRFTFKEYQGRVGSTLVTKTYEDTTLMCVMGIAGEIGELINLFKKFFFHKKGNKWDAEKIVDEIGDVYWYCATLINALGTNIEKVESAKYYQDVLRSGSLRSPDHKYNVVLLTKLLQETSCTIYEKVTMPGIYKVSVTEYVARILVLLEEVLLQVEKHNSKFGTVDILMTPGEAMLRNLSKLQKRHGESGFNSDYKGDSGY